MAGNPLERVVDALDIETFIISKNEEEAISLMRRIMADMGLKDTDIVFCQHLGPGARVRARGYIFRSGDHYGWLKEEA